MNRRISLVTILNDDALYAASCNTILATLRDDISIELELLPVRADHRAWNAATAYNDTIEQFVTRRTSWVICVHQDVLFPQGWLQRLIAQLDSLPSRTAVVGLVGRTPPGEFSGHVLDPWGHTRWTRSSTSVATLDEHLLILRADAGLRFDRENPGFHAYGADICLEARDRGYEARTIDCPVVHLSGGPLDVNFHVAKDWLFRKWSGRISYEIPLCSTPVDRSSVACHCSDLKLPHFASDSREQSSIEAIVARYPFVVSLESDQ